MKPKFTKPNALEFKQNVPFIKKGLDLDQVWFSGGRTGLALLRHGGIGEILYYGKQALTSSMMFKAGTQVSSWEKLFRLCLVIEGTPYYPEFNHTFFYPFGYVSQCSLAGVRFQHEMLLLNDAVVQRVKILSNPKKKSLALKLIFHGFNRFLNSNRKWSEWKTDAKGTAISTTAVDSFSDDECRQQIESKMKDVRAHFPVSDTPYGETHLALSSDRPILVKVAREQWKYYVTTQNFTDRAALAVVFAPGAGELKKRILKLSKEVHRESDGLIATWQERQDAAPDIRIPSAQVVQSCLANIPRVIDAVEVKDLPGGFRAGMQGYWVWFDLMLDGSAFLYANDAPSLRDMILFFNRVADDKLGIPCLVTTHVTPHLGTPFNTQCPFITTLYNYYCHTGDTETLRECYPLARRLIEKCLEKEVKGTGLVEGAGFPDFPIDQDGHDVSSSSNSYFYQAVMAMRYLSREMSRLTGEKRHEEFAGFCQAVGERTCKNFIRYFFDRKKGYFLDSLSSRDFSPRRHYAAFAIQWNTPFAKNLIAGNAARIADFLAKNFTRPHGIGPLFPPWDSAYPGDGNQFLAYYPSWTETFYRNTMKAAGRTRELAKWFDDVAWFWQRYTIPEGFTYDAENEGFTPDNPGGKQAFGGLAWYGVFFRTIIGYEVDERGVVISPSPIRKEMAVKNLMVRGKRIDITVTGKGKRTEVSCNGKIRSGSEIIIPFSELKDRNHLVI